LKTKRKLKSWARAAIAIQSLRGEVDDRKIDVDKPRPQDVEFIRMALDEENKIESAANRAVQLWEIECRDRVPDFVREVGMKGRKKVTGFSLASASKIITKENMKKHKSPLLQTLPKSHPSLLSNQASNTDIEQYHTELISITMEKYIEHKLASQMKVARRMLIVLIRNFYSNRDYSKKLPNVV